MKWGSSCKSPTYHFECAMCGVVDGTGPRRFTAYHTPASCPTCGIQYKHVTDTRKGSKMLTREVVEQLHLR